MTMKRTQIAVVGVTSLVIALAGLAPTQPAQAAATTKCEMTFGLREWSAIYKVARGNATITCDNGEKSDVRLELNAAGFTAGRSVVEGKGKFSDVGSIGDLFGSYVTADVAAGAVKAVGATVMTKGEVSLGLTSRGSGWDVGLSFGKFTITATAAR
jgi:hypothetical protein